MFRLFTAALLISLIAAPASVLSAQPLGDCSLEPQLAGRSDVVMCEPWETDTWWSDHSFVYDGGLPPHRPIEPDRDLPFASITSSGCKDGNCLKLFAQQYVSRTLSIHWPLAAAGLEPEELYFRYYMKLGPNWNAKQCKSTGEQVWPPGGKFPGFADVRDYDDPGEQCGNGGAKSDGINCWSGRGVFEGCRPTPDDGTFSYANSCEFVPNAITRIGSYMYIPNTTSSHGANAFWDFVPEGQEMGDDYSSSCRREDPDNPNPACYCNSTNNLFCGQGTGGILRSDRWYAIETYVKMNTPGVADGIMRGWIDGKLSYEKTNVLFRKVGHDNLHVRTVWLDVYKGGVSGNCNSGYVYLDQMVVAQEPIGILSGDQVAPQPPENLNVQ